jgi:hypothetical protein
MTDFIMSIVPLWRQEYKLRCKEMCEVSKCVKSPVVFRGAI